MDFLYVVSTEDGIKIENELGIEIPIGNIMNGKLQISEDELIELFGTKEQFENELNLMQTTIENIEYDNEYIREENIDLENKITDLEDNIIDLEDNIIDLQSTISNLEEKNEDLEEENKNT